MNDIENSDSDDPYVGLEQDSCATKRFVKEANKFCLMSLEDPILSPRYQRILKILESDERIPYVSKMGSTENGDDELYNLWRDSKVRIAKCILEEFPFILSHTLLSHVASLPLNVESQRNLEKNHSIILSNRPSRVADHFGFGCTVQDRVYPLGVERKQSTTTQSRPMFRKRKKSHQSTDILVQRYR
jgi:hypothetical protein